MKPAPMADDALRLLPCPFCGYEAELRKQYSALEGDPKHYVRCSNGNCGARYVPGGFPVAEWNDRALESVREEALDTEAVRFVAFKRGFANARTEAMRICQKNAHQTGDFLAVEIAALQHVDAAALIEKLGQGWVSIAEPDQRADYVSEYQRRIKTVRWIGDAYEHFVLELPPLPPPPERP